jgi:hypothetical protein
MRFQEDGIWIWNSLLLFHSGTRMLIFGI